MDIDLTRLRHILAVARTQNFSRAAEELNITQPALSRSIASFEERRGVRLFDRSRSGVVPTSVGRVVIAEAEEVVRAARGLDLNLKLYAGGQAGQLSIGLGPLLASVLLTSIGKYAMRTRPGLEIQTIIRPADQLLIELLNDRIEIIFGNSWIMNPTADLAISPLGNIPMTFIVRAGHPLAEQRDVMTCDIQRYPLAGASGWPMGRQPGHGGSFVCDNFHILRELVMETDFVWMASAALARQEIASGRLVTLEVADFQPKPSAISLVRRQGRTLSPAANMIADHVRVLLSCPADVGDRHTSEAREIQV